MAIICANLSVYVLVILGEANVTNYVTYLILTTLLEADFLHIGCMSDYQ